MKRIALSLMGCIVLASVVAHADTTLTNQSLTETYSNANQTPANYAKLTMIGTNTLTANSNASVNITDSTMTSWNLGGSTGGLETIAVNNTGSGHFTLSLGNLVAGNSSSSPDPVNFVTTNTGGGTVAITTGPQAVGRGGDGNDLTFWAFYNGNDFASTTTTTGGTLGPSTAYYNDGGNDTHATDVTTWASNTSAAHNQDYKDDTASAYSGTMTGNATEHGIRFANSAGATINLGGHNLIDAGILDAQGAGAVTISNGNLTAATLTNELIVNQNNLANKMTISANLTGASVFVKTGVGTLVLSGTSNTYSGITTIDQGTLVNDSTIGSSTTYLNGSATLAGTGTFSQLVTVTTTGSTLAPGDIGSIGTLRLNGGLTVSNGLTMNFSLNNTGGVSSINMGSGTLSLTGTVAVNFTLLNGTINTADTYNLIVGTGTWTASPTFTFTAPAGYQVLTNTYSHTAGNDFLAVTFATVPEPSTWALIGLGTLGLLFLARRRLA